VIELKTGVELTCTGIAKTDADQLRGSLQWNTDTYGAVAAVPVMVDPVDVIRPSRRNWRIRSSPSAGSSPPTL
jgi:hypothetical protein